MKSLKVGGILGLALVLIACAGETEATPTKSAFVAVPIATAFAESGGNPQSPDLMDQHPVTPLPGGEIPSGGFTPARIVAPSIGMDASVVATDWTPGGEWKVPNGAAGWLENSAFAGQSGNTVIAGHHNTEGEVFRRVAELVPGDSITLETESQAVRYVVTERLILPQWGISPEQEVQYATWIDRTRDNRLTLVTCWPYVTNSHRVIVVAKPVAEDLHESLGGL
jgi:LPXTG-site transpeptidase (sortase) family protein